MLNQQKNNVNINSLNRLCWLDSFWGHPGNWNLRETSKQIRGVSTNQLTRLICENGSENGCVELVTLSLRSGLSLVRRRDGVWRSGSCLICPRGISPGDELISDVKFIPVKPVKRYNTVLVSDV